MPEIQGGRWDQLLTRFFGLKGPVAPGLSGEIVSTFPVNPFSPELYRLLGWRLMFGRAAQGNVAAQFSHVNLRNDSTDHLIVVTGVCGFTTSGATLISLARGNSAVGVAVTVAARDGRVGVAITAGSVAGVLRSGTAAAITGTRGWEEASSAANVSALFADALPVILFPNDSLIIWNETVNQTLYGSFAWQERPFEPGENL